MLALCYTPLQAQVGKYRSDLAIGVGGGLLMNTVSFSPSVQQVMHMGPEVGVAIRYTCEKYFAMVCALQVELNYSRQGWSEQAEDGSYSYLRHMNYIHLPLLARLGFGRERKGFMGYIVLGPQLGYCISQADQRHGSWTSEGVPTTPESATEHYNKDVEKPFEYGIVGGAGVEYSHPRLGHFTLEGRYHFGLSDIFGNGKRDPFARSANSGIIVRLSYFFDLKKTKDKSIK